jgi:hypothetical protein
LGLGIKAGLEITPDPGPEVVGLAGIDNPAGAILHKINAARLRKSFYAVFQLITIHILKAHSIKIISDSSIIGVKIRSNRPFFAPSANQVFYQIFLDKEFIPAIIQAVSGAGRRVNFRLFYEKPLPNCF